MSGDVTLPELPVGAVAPEAPAAPPPVSPAPSPADPTGRLLEIASAHEQAGRLDEAEAALRQIIDKAADNAHALHLLGIVSFKKSRLDEAAQLMEQSIALAPTAPLYHRNICEIYRVLGRLDEALAAGRRALALAPNDMHCYHNLAVLHYHRLELDEAIRCGEQALAIAPDFPGAHFGIAEASLLRGDLARGWEEYEWRMRLANAPPLLPRTDRPLWDGTPLTEAGLLLIADQGYGDVIQFARYLPWAAARCPEIAVACSSELHPALAQLPGGDALFSHWEKAPEFAAYCPLSGLPRLAGTRLETIPAEIPYLHAEPAKTAQWSARLDTLIPQRHRRIGIVWAGRPTHHNDRNRSVELATFGPLAELPDTTLVALQKGPGQAQIGAYWGRAPLVNLGPELRDFGDTMAVLDCLDCVVTIDSAVAHLAGAMGKPVTVMLPYAPDWRWLLDRDDSPWYPTMRLRRQGPDRRWEPVAAAVAAELRPGMTA